MADRVPLSAGCETHVDRAGSHPGFYTGACSPCGQQGNADPCQRQSCGDRPKPGTYVTLDRVWKSGDTVTFSLPMDFHLTRYVGMEPSFGQERFALEYGPILLASPTRVPTSHPAPLGTRRGYPARWTDADLARYRRQYAPEVFGNKPEVGQVGVPSSGPGTPAGYPAELGGGGHPRG